MRGSQILAVLLIILCGAVAETRAQMVFSFISSAVPTAQAGFRANLGTLNPNVAGSFGSGHRIINWDGVPDAFSAPNNLPADFFNVNSPRGVIFETPGSGFQVSGDNDTPPDADPDQLDFSNIDATYPSAFGAFSPQRLFTSLESNVMTVRFVVPGSSTPAVSNAFGAIFTDVDLANTTKLDLFDAAGNLLGTHFVQDTFAPGEDLSFLGIKYDTPVIGSVRITSGNAALGAGINDTNGNPTDLVVMDDFIYGEPVAVPEPSTLILGGVGALGLALLRSRAVRREASPVVC